VNLKHTLLLLLFAVALHVHVTAQSFRFDHVTGREGLSQSQAYCMLHDSEGYLWIGTQDGLNRFDGSEFKVFKNDPFDSTTLTHNWIWSVEEDRHGDLWLGTFQGLCKYVRKENRFVQYYNKPNDSTTVSGNRTNYVLRDSKNRLWVSSWGSGLSLYNDKTNTFRQFRHNADDQRTISDNYVRAIFCDREGTLWVGTWNGGLNRVLEDASGNVSFQHYYSTENNMFQGGNQITSIAEDKQGNLWIGSYQGGLFQFNKKTNQFRRVPEFVANDINKVLGDAQGNIWIGTNNGLKFWNATAQTFRTYHHHPNQGSSISSNTIYALLQDRNGMVWVAGNGLDKYDPRKNIFRSYENEPDNKNSLSENSVWSFCEDDEGKIWIGGESGPLNVYDPVTGTFRHVTIHDDRGNLASNVQRLIQADSVFWIASFNNGLIRYDKHTGRSRFFLGSHPSPLGKTAFIKEVLRDRDGTLWVGTYDEGLIHYDPQTEAVTHYRTSKSDPRSIGSDFINSIMQDRQGNIWIGFMGGGISVYDKKTSAFTHYRYDRKNASGLSDQMVSSITQESDSIFWICTHSGINRLNVHTGKFRHFFEKDGLANNVAYEMLHDPAGFYWISTNKGLSKFNPQTYTFRNYTKEDGLQDDEFNANASLRSRRGQFYFGGVKGFSVFDPAQIQPDTVPPQLIIQSYSIFDKVFTPESSLALDYDQNYITIRFAALEFSSPEKIRYRYKLEGIDADWIDAGTARQAHYTNLDPGRYTFRVKAANEDGYWTEPGATMNLIIHPPFWKTGWFITLSVVFCGLLIYAAHRYRLEQSLKVERLRNKIASDLHDEVGSSLTRISIYSELVQNGTTVGTESNSYLKNIGTLSREVVSTMSDIVWSIDNRYDTVEALVLRMKDFAIEMLQTRNITLEFHTGKFDLTKILDPATKQNIYLIFKEAVNNIVKHAQATRVAILFSDDKGTLTLTIQDNGKGLPTDSSGKGHGLRNMKRRAEAIGATLTFVQEAGTTIHVRGRSL
jgi:ligand-binding sensor domain-containing protein/signal transduction histidine kinase